MMRMTLRMRDFAELGGGAVGTDDLGVGEPLAGGLAVPQQLEGHVVAPDDGEVDQRVDGDEQARDPVRGGLGVERLRGRVVAQPRQQQRDADVEQQQQHDQDRRVDQAADEAAADAGDGVAEGYILGRVDGILFTQQIWLG